MVLSKVFFGLIRMTILQNDYSVNSQIPIIKHEFTHKKKEQTLLEEFWKIIFSGLNDLKIYRMIKRLQNQNILSRALLMRCMRLWFCKSSLNHSMQHSSRNSHSKHTQTLGIVIKFRNFVFLTFFLPLHFQQFVFYVECLLLLISSRPSISQDQREVNNLNRRV